MKKFISMLLCLLLLAAGSVSAFGTEDGKISVVSTIFPPYDFVRQIAGDQVELTMLLSPGSESHSFEPSPRDIITIQKADIFLYVGGETDAWVDRILDSMDTEGMTILALTDMVETVSEELVEGMEHEHDHAHEAFAPEDVQDRPLTDWQGEWQSVYPLLKDDAPDADKWESDILTMTLAEDTLRINTADASHEADYTYAGFTIVEGEHGDAVWYQFSLETPTDGMPASIAFSDHGIGGEHDEHEADEHKDEEGLPHFHMRYGEEDFDALTTIEGWAPTFFPTGADKEAIVAALDAHGSSHDEEEEEAEMDEHVWTSPRNAKRIVQSIADTLGTLDTANATAYQANAEAYLTELDALDAAFAETVASGTRTTLVFGDRFPFRYLADAYGLDYFAAFPGCATETEASAATIAFLIDKTAEEEIPVVFTIEFSNGKIADVISESTGATKLEMHSCHNVSKQDFDSGIGYLDLMWRNVDMLKEAL